ncbi:MAG: hypothetical protein ACYC3I_18210 [Gemmataceae bacterium]
MNDETYRLPRTSGRLSVMGHLTACRTCGRKILVEMALIGTPHHVGVSVNCGECLVLTDQMRKEHPEIASKFESWLKGGSQRDEPEA